MAWEDFKGPVANILIVEDEWLVGMDLAEMVEEFGLIVIGPAQNVATALELIGKHDIHGAFLDVNLGRETSLEIAELLSRKLVPFTILTAYNSEDIPDFWSFERISKPVSSRSLRNELTKMLERRIA